MFTGGCSGPHPSRQNPTPTDIRTRTGLILLSGIPSADADYERERRRSRTSAATHPAAARPNAMATAVMTPTRRVAARDAAEVVPPPILPGLRDCVTIDHTGFSAGGNRPDVLTGFGGPSPRSAASRSAAERESIGSFARSIRARAWSAVFIDCGVRRTISADVFPPPGTSHRGEFGGRVSRCRAHAANVNATRHIAASRPSARPSRCRDTPRRSASEIPPAPAVRFS